MGVIKVIKKLDSYSKLTNSARDEISFDDDRGVSEFRAFYPVAGVYVSRVTNPIAIDVMLEVLDTLKSNLQNRKEMLTLQ